MSEERKLEIKHHLLNNKRVLGNTKTSLVNLASDLVNSLGKAKGVRSQLSEATFLSMDTIERISTLKETETGRPYLPNSDTIERVLIFFNVELNANQVRIKSRYMNTPKAWL